MSLLERQAELIKEFSRFEGWEDKYKYIIEMGKALPPYPEDKRLDQFKVTGCQAQVWVWPEKRGEHVVFHADSDALITKGLIALLLRVYSDADPAEILKTPPAFIKELGLETKLSPSRANGLFSMVREIMKYALVFAT